MAQMVVSKLLKIPSDGEARIEFKLNAAGGATMREIGADLAERFGAIADVKREIATHQKEYLGDKEKEVLLALERKERDREFRTKEIGLWSESARQYIIKKYGEETKDGLGYTVGFGERIGFNKENGHLRLRW